MRNGFTLVELSIVLLVVGLLAGGIMAGKSLMHAAEMNAILSDIERYTTAHNTFKNNYGDMPGDLSDAQSYWSACVDDAPNNCNGDGDGVIDTPYESLRYWQHLSLSEIIQENYTGVFSDPTEIILKGENVPAELSVNGVYWTTYNNTPEGYHNLLTLASLDSASPPQPSLGVLLPEDAYGIDMKIDDGYPDSGKILGYNQSGGELCYSSGAYVLAEENTYCLFMAILDE